jgi:multisubunit Na+/H+ antiporter MnhB subunit
LWPYGGTGIGFACLLVALHNVLFIIYFIYKKNKRGWVTALLMAVVLLLAGLVMWWLLGPGRLY